MFSKSCEYGLRAAIFIAQQSLLENKSGVKMVAEKIGSPEAFTGKILKDLSKEKIIKSVKGPYGGFYIEKEAMKKTTLLDIVRAIDGDKIYKGCALGLEKCSEKKPCPLHNQFVEVREHIRKMLKENTLLSMTDKQTPFFLKI